MKLRPIASALLMAVLAVKGSEVRAVGWAFNEALSLEEKVAYALIESMLSLARMRVEYSHSCTGNWSMNVIVSNQTIFSDGDTRGFAWANIDDVDLEAVFDTASDMLWQTKGVKIDVVQVPNGVDELHDTKVAGFEGFYAYDWYGTMASANTEVELDQTLFGESAIKDFWDMDLIEDADYPAEDLGHSRVKGEGLELVMKAGYPRAKWGQSSYLWRSNGGNGYLIVTGNLVGPDPVRAGCEIVYSALVDNLANGFQTLSGEVELTAPGT